MTKVEVDRISRIENIKKEKPNKKSQSKEEEVQKESLPAKGNDEPVRVEISLKSKDLEQQPTQESEDLKLQLAKKEQTKTEENLKVVERRRKDLATRFDNEQSNEAANIKKKQYLQEVATNTENNIAEKENQEKKIKEIVKDTKQEYLGKEGDRLTLNIRYINTRFIPTLNCYAHDAITDTNHLINFLNKAELGKAGISHTIQGRVKKQAVNYQTKTAETQLNYVKVLDKILVWQ